MTSFNLRQQSDFRFETKKQKHCLFDIDYKKNCSSQRAVEIDLKPNSVEVTP